MIRRSSAKPEKRYLVIVPGDAGKAGKPVQIQARDQ